MHAPHPAPSVGTPERKDVADALRTVVAKHPHTWRVWVAEAADLALNAESNVRVEDWSEATYTLHRCLCLLRPERETTGLPMDEISNLF